MLSSAETIDVIAETLPIYQIPFVVLDPVMVSTSGSQLLPEKAVKELRTKLLPFTTILTPNIPEAQLLLKDAGADAPEPVNLEELILLAKKVCSLGSKAVLLKGGHLALTKEYKKAQSAQEATTVVDVLFDGENVTLLETEYLVSKNTHGTGCSLASAIAANLAQGKDMARAVRSAVRFVEAGIKTSTDLGRGSGPINHFHSVYTMPFAPYVILALVIGTTCTDQGTLVEDSSNTFWIVRMSSRCGRDSHIMNLWMAWARARFRLNGSKNISCKTIST